MNVLYFQGFVLKLWCLGIGVGGYHYSLKMYVFEKVRARNFARAWGFVQASQEYIQILLKLIYLFTALKYKF